MKLLRVKKKHKHKISKITVKPCSATAVSENLASHRHASADVFNIPNKVSQSRYSEMLAMDSC